MRLILFRRHSAISLLRSAFLSAMMIEVTAANAQTLADLSITKQVTPTIAAPGNFVVYTLTIHNLGPDSAITPIVTDILPSGLTLISAPLCVETPPTVLTCNLGPSLAPGAEVSTTIVARVGNIPDGTLQNGANVASNTTDPDPSNNDASATLRVAAAPIPSLGLTELVLLALLLAALAIYRIGKFARTSDSRG